MVLEVNDVTDWKINDIHRLRVTLFQHAKRYWLISYFLQFITVIISILSTWLPWRWFYVTSGFLAVISSICKWRSDYFKVQAEAILRVIEDEDFGYLFSDKQRADLLVSLPNQILKKAWKLNGVDPYFSSETPPSPRRAIENLLESSWFTKHLANKMSQWVRISLCFVILVLAMTIFVSWQSISSKEVTQAVGKTVISIIVFLFSAGLFRLYKDYERFSNAADKIIDRAETMLSKNKIDPIEAFRLRRDYQVIRQGAPLIPDFLYKYYRDRLNDMWKIRVSKKSNTTIMHSV